MLAMTSTTPGAHPGSDRETLEECILRCAAGDKEGLAALYELTRVAVYGFALSILRNAEDAEEISQDVYLQVFRRAEDYQPHGKPMAWLLTITRNLSLNRVKERSRSVPLEETYGVLASREEVTPEDRLALEAMLGGLEDRERQIVALHAVGGLKHREIAAVLDMALPTVLSKYSRAIKKLQKAWKEAQ